ncbi:unnamed protein product [Zymoseptoria tritici ST99CH_1E4]|uniref:Peroxisomal membrane protein PEX14 n=1 Tax=Zymoseptoria tritici ST99CH_1E4 TaxID=1276532 RepID=A0A2H1G449_ZYMTR|nr:unnamed protein product [Zymoseptoria tritici ST99CH_1E4]
MVREDLIEGAVSFLQDPSVANAPIEQRIAFLRSKNLTQDEIDTSLARVGQSPASSQPPVAYRQPQQYNNTGYQPAQQGYPPQWQQPPPEPPHRDWRDYFIAATVFGGAGYALYWTAKRYIYPLISPPTPAQIEQDKSSIDASFDKAFALLDQLATDTQELKSNEAARKERLDSALGDVEGVVGRMKAANEDRELESKRIAKEIGDIRDSIPKALEKEKAATEERLKELVAEVKSLKTLVANRMQGGGAPPARSTPSFSSTRPATDAPSVNGTGAIPSSVENGAPETNGTAASASPYTAPVYNSQTPNSGNTPTAARELPNRDGANTTYSRLLGGKAAIPSWQLAAKKKSEDAKAAEAGSAAVPNGQNVQESGTVSESTEAAA